MEVELATKEASGTNKRIRSSGRSGERDRGGLLINHRAQANRQPEKEMEVSLYGMKTVTAIEFGVFVYVVWGCT